MSRSTVLLVLTAIATMQATAETEIFRCALDDGTFAFQEKPCAGPTVEASSTDEAESDEPASEQDDFFDFVNPYDSPQDPAPNQKLSEPVSDDRAECIETTRDAIDAIDATLAEKAASDEDSRAHLAELLELTRQLRACKTL